MLLAFGVGMLERVQCYVDVAWHRDVDSPVGVIPRKGEATEKRSGPVDRDGVQAAECYDDMVRRVIARVLDAKIVDNKREHYGQVSVCPERRRAGGGRIAVFGEMQSEAVVGNDASFLEAGHDFSDIKVDLAIQGKFKKIVLCDDLVRDGVEGQTYVLVAVRGRIIIEIFNV